MSFTLSGDIKLFYESGNEDIVQPADFKLSSGLLEREGGFETMVTLLLFSDARAEDSDILPPSQTDRRGFSGSLNFGYNFGSKLWLLEREPVTIETAEKVEAYTLEALEIMKTDGIAQSIESTSSIVGAYQINNLVSINRKSADNIKLKYYINWEYQTRGGVAE